MSMLDHILGPRPRMTLVVENARIVEIWVEGRAPLIAVRDYDWGETDPEARRDEDGVSFSDINWRGPAWALGLSLHPPVRPSHPLGGYSFLQRK